MRTLGRVGVLAGVLLSVMPVPAVFGQAVKESTPPASLPAVNSIVDGTLGPYMAPTCVPGVPFTDITCTTGFDAWIEQFGRDGITGGCGGGDYCPGTPVTRDQMAVFIERAMRGTANWPAHTQLVWAVKNPDGSPNATGSGQALVAAIAAIPTSGNDAPSASNPWLVKLGPGIYDLGTAQPPLPAYVSMEGSGVDVTVIQTSNGVGPLMTIKGNANVSFLTVITTGTAAQESGLWLAGPTRLSHIGIRVSGGTSINSALVVNETGTSTLNNVRLEASGGGTSSNRGIELQAGTVTAHVGDYIASGGANGYGILLFAGTAQVFDVTLEGSSDAVDNIGGTADVAGSQLTSTVSGTVVCAGVYDGSFGFHASTCP